MTEETPRLDTPDDLSGKEQKQAEATNQEPGPVEQASVPTRFVRSAEGHIFMCACCMIVLWLAAIALLLHKGQPLWSDMLTMGFAHMLAGRAASIAHATQAEMPSTLIAFLATYTDVMVMFIVYPVLVFSYKNLFEKRFFQKHMNPVFESARKRMSRLRRFEIAGGVFLFVWFPFWMTGIIMGAVLGFLLGLRTWVNMTTVILGSASATICWVYAYDKLYIWVGQIHQVIPLVLTLLIISGLITYRVFSRRRCRA